MNKNSEGNMKNFFLRLTSRKFLLTLAAALILVANEQWTELVILVSGYMGIEGIGDAADRVAAQKTKQVELVQATQQAKIETFNEDDDDIDLTVINPGSQTTTTSPGLYGGDAPL
jgi:hypothetical protein